MENHFFSNEPINYIILSIITLFLAPFVNQFLNRYFTLRKSVTGKYFLIFTVMTAFSIASFIAKLNGIVSHVIFVLLIIASVFLLQSLIYSNKENLLQIFKIKYLYFNSFFIILGFCGISDNKTLLFIFIALTIIFVVLYAYILKKTGRDFSFVSILNYAYKTIIKYYKISIICFGLIIFVVLGISKCSPYRIDMFDKNKKVVSSEVIFNNFIYGSLIPHSFKENSKIIWLRISKDISVIDNKAYKNADYLRKVVIPANVEYISDEAFADCKNLKEVIFEPGEYPLVLGNNVFENCPKLKKIDFGNRVAATGSGICNNCPKLETVILSENQNYKCIEQYTFYKCLKLASVEIPENIKEIGEFAFGECEKLKKIDFDNVEVLNTGAFYNSGLLSVNTNKIQTIPESCFEGCKYLGAYFDNKINMVILTNVETIETDAFRNCINLKRIEDYANLKFIGKNAFRGCALKEFIVRDKIETIEPCAFFDCKNLNFTNVEVLNTVSFNNSDYLSVNINKIKTIPEKFFEGCKCYGANSNNNVNMVSLTNVENIDRNCINHKAIENYDNLKNIGKNLFRGCALREFKVKDKTETIEPCVFFNCKNQNFHNESNVSDEIKKFYIDEKGFLYKIYEKDNMKQKVLIAASAGFDGEFNVDKDVTDIYAGAFANCKNITSIKVDTDNGYFVSDKNAIYKIKPVKKLVYFYSDINVVNSIDINTNIIGSYAFAGKNIIYIDLFDTSINTIEESAFERCQKLSYIKLPLSLKTLGKNVFKSCTFLSEISVPYQVVDIPDGTFEKCENLKNVHINGKLKSIGKDAFRYTIIDKYEFPDSVEIIKSGAFKNCDLLKVIKIKKSNIKYIDENAFDEDKTFKFTE